jgi:hypothetical protein
MSILNLFKKPNWKNKDTDIRATAVTTEKSPELMAQLPNISQHDDSEKVRTSALRRLTDFKLIAQIAEKDKSKSVKSAANKMLIDWFTQSSSDLQLTIIGLISDNKTIEVIASQAQNNDVRTHCINQISKQGLLGDLLISERDKNLRQLIVNKIDKPATLKRLLKAVKNKDKTILKIIQVKLENDGDMQQIINKKALDLCEQMEKLIHNPNSSSKDDVIAIKASWDELNQDNATDSFKQRFEGALRTASLTFDPQQRDAFLSQQRLQKINAKINELQSSLKDKKLDSWEKIQSQISKYSGFDLDHADTEQKDLFKKLLSDLKELRDTKSKEQELPDQLLTVVDKLDSALKHKYNQPNQITQFRKMWDDNAKSVKHNAAFNTLKSRFDKAMLKLADKVENSATLRDEAAKNAVNSIKEVRQLIKDGHLADAKIGINKIAHNKKVAGHHNLINEHKFEFDALWNELSELRKWQTWSNDKIRIRLIEELQELVGTGTHPDALLKKMKESNAQWKDMEEHEKLEGDRYGVRNQELYTQFRAVQQALFEPAQQFFEARSEIWGKELEGVEANIQALYDVDLTETADRDLAHQVREAIKQLRNLDKIPPKNRGRCAARIRSGIARIDEHLQESYKVASRRKEKLIEQAQELIELEDLESAIEQAKSLQSEWKNAGIVQQAQERKLWKAFRKANDAVFNRIKVQRDQVNQENKELMDQANSLITTCDKQMKSEKTAQAIHSLIEKFKDDFNALNIENKGILSKAQKLIASSEDKVNSMANSEVIDALKNAQKFANLCQQLELGEAELDSVQEKWNKLKQLSDKKITAKLQKRFDNASSPNEQFSEQANQLLIAAEYLTGQATPDAYKEQRLAYQVEELSKRMSGETSLNATDKAIQILNNWYVLNGADKGFIKANDKRIKKDIKGLFDLLKA